MEATTRNGKVASLPHGLRETLCARMLDGERGPELLAWLNAQPETQARLAEKFDGVEITAQNLSEWRRGGYQDWLRDRAEVRKLAALAELSSKLAAAGHGIAAGAQALLAADMMNAMELLDTKEKMKYADALATIRSQDQSAQLGRLKEKQVEQKERQIAQKAADQKLAREKYEAQFLTDFMKYVKDPKVAQILSSGGTKTAQMAELRKRLFGSGSPGDSSRTPEPADG